MKVTIEFELPDGQAIPKVEDILTLTSPDWLVEQWSIEDVQAECEWVTRDQAREVLLWMKKYHDSTVGINWEFIKAVVDNKFPEPEEVDA